MSVTKTQDYKISLAMAILININIMLGAGIFVNTAELITRAGILSCGMYLLTGLLMLPLILSIAELLRLHPAGGFYTFAQKEISPFVGFLSSWCYFTSKLASCMLMTHVSMTLLQTFIPSLAIVPVFFLDVLVICLYVGLNMLNIKAGSTIQSMLIGFKTIPIFFAIFGGLFLLQADALTAPIIPWQGIFSSLPLVIYAVIGFEAACSVSSKIQDADKNAPKAVLISFGIVILIATLYQSIFYLTCGSHLAGGHYQQAFPSLIHGLFGDNIYARKLIGLLHVAIASSTLGAGYGIIFSNGWNLYTLAQNNHVAYSEFFTRLNRHMIPFACVVAQGFLCLAYLAVSQGNQIPLQQIGSLGCVISYTFSVAALLYAIKNNAQASISRWIPILGGLSCCVLLSATFMSFFKNGMSSLLVYGFLVLMGILMYWVKRRTLTA
jgi:amino acid transporter